MAKGTLRNNKLLYTVHGSKKPLGVLAMFNQKEALAYINFRSEDDEIVGYTYLEEMMQKACTCKLPSYTANF